MRKQGERGSGPVRGVEVAKSRKGWEDLLTGTCSSQAPPLADWKAVFLNLRRGFKSVLGREAFSPHLGALEGLLQKVSTPCSQELGNSSASSVPMLVVAQVSYCGRMGEKVCHRPRERSYLGLRAWTQLLSLATST